MIYIYIQQRYYDSSSAEYFLFAVVDGSLVSCEIIRTAITARDACRKFGNGLFELVISEEAPEEINK